MKYKLFVHHRPIVKPSNRDNSVLTQNTRACNSMRENTRMLQMAANRTIRIHC